MTHTTDELLAAARRERDAALDTIRALTTERDQYRDQLNVAVQNSNAKDEKYVSAANKYATEIVRQGLLIRKLKSREKKAVKR